MPDALPEDEPFGPEQFAAQTHVSRETLARLKAYAGLLTDWNSRHNLVSARSLDDLWRRHFWDSAQLVPLIPPAAKSLADLGSGAGFPGLVLAEMLRGRVAVTLYEATAKKCAFLAAAAERMELAVTIRNVRTEEAPSAIFDVVTARACAPLPKLLSYAHKFTGQNSVCLFLKGQNVGPELTEAHKSWKMKVRHIPSLTDPSGVILELADLASHEPITQKTPRPGRRQSKGRGW
ncbi:MAG TPA: 16S rRNA (guanine(527)-N(7))-methyltransferase RsmG [Rhizomicrobium sp.]|nr:16S rRNA (guanine(527)-N(7))-methyltransferase RsmG [Rhizomicrobium sp.]